MLRTIVTDRAPKAIGPYVQAVDTGHMLFLSGQIGLDPASGELVAGDAAAQARQALANLKEVLESAGYTAAGVVKTTVYLTDLGAFAAVNEVYAGVFSTHRPARSTVQVAALPKGALVEIDAIAIKPGTAPSGVRM